MTPRAALFWLWAAGCAPSGAPAAGRPVAVERRDLVVDVEVSGALRSLETESVGPPNAQDLWAFKLARMVAEGTAARPGDEVLGFDPSELEKKLTDYQSRAARVQEEISREGAQAALGALEEEQKLAEAEAALRKAELTADKPADLTAARELRVARIKRDVARRELELKRQAAQARRQQAAADLRVLESRLVRARQRVADIQAQIAAMSVKARRAGTVVYTQDSDGKKRTVGDTVGRGASVLEIASLDRMAAQGQVHEVDASQVAAGQLLGLRLESNPDKEYAGQIEQVGALVQTESPTSKVRVVQLEIGLKETDPLLMRPGSRFRGRVEIARVPAVVQVPLAAIESTPAGPVARRLEGGRPVIVPLRLGRRTRDAVEVLEGLRAGDKVLVRGEAEGAEQGSPRLGAS